MAGGKGGKGQNMGGKPLATVPITKQLSNSGMGGKKPPANKR